MMTSNLSKLHGCVVGDGVVKDGVAGIAEFSSGGKSKELTRCVAHCDLRRSQ
jgi:hypothetical protein